MKQIVYFLIIVTISILAWGCPDDDGDRIWIINKSEKDVLYYIAITDQEYHSCSDSLLPKKKLIHLLKKGDITSEANYPEYICDTVRVFLLDVDTVNAYPWKKIRLDNNIIKRYDLSLEELRKMNSIITYP